MSGTCEVNGRRMGGKEVKTDAQRVEGKKTALGVLCKESY